MVATWWTAWCAVTNSNPWTGSYWSPAQTRPRLLRGSLALRGAAGPRAGADAPRHAPPSRDRPFARRRRGPLASPSSGSPGPRARTGAPTPQASALCGPTRRSAAGTPARTADGSSASWTHARGAWHNLLETAVAAQGIALARPIFWHHWSLDVGPYAANAARPPQRSIRTSQRVFRRGRH